MDINKSIKLIEKWLDIPVEGGLDLDVSNAIELLIEFAKQQQWQPIETVPKDGSYILLYVDQCWIEGHFNIQSNRFNYATLPSHGCGCCGYEDPYPTTWMPLPQTPEE